jgi:putative ABC transport system permease protein
LSFPLVRLPADMSPPQAESAISAALEGVAPGPPGKPRRATLRPLYEYQIQGGRPTATVFFTGAMLVLLLVTINVSHLFLTRGVVRAPEVAMRTALGASRWRIVRTFLVESLLIGGVGIAGGLVLGRWLASLIATAVPRFPTGARNLALVPTTFDWRAVVFACVLGVVIAAVGGLWPAWRAVRRPSALNVRGAAGLGAGLSARASQAILGSAVAVATVIMIGTVFMGLGIWRYLGQPLGFSLTDRFSVSLEMTGGPPAPGAATPWLDALEAIRQTPGVRAASTYWSRSASPLLVGDEMQPRKDLDAVEVLPGYFEAWGNELVSGRLFSREEMAADARLAVVDERFARSVWPDQDPLGKIVRVRDAQPRLVIGVIRLERRRLSIELHGQAYVPRLGQDRRESLVVFAPGLSEGELRTRLESRLPQALPGVRPVLKALSFDTYFVRDAGEAYFQRPVVIAFGLLAFVLAGIGLFGLVVYLVEQRIRDYGIRLALGARPGDIAGQVARLSLMPAAGGLVAGVVVARLLERFVQASVFGWQSSGLVAGSVVSVALAGVAVIAAVAPARRALRIDPIRVLRSE